MTTSADLQALVHAALTATPTTTACGARVYEPGDWPTWDNQYPAMKLRVIRESKVSNGRGEVSFTTTTTLRALVQVSAPASPDDGGAAATEAALWAIQRQFEVAVINNYDLWLIIQQAPTIDAQFAYSSEGEKHLAGSADRLGHGVLPGAGRLRADRHNRGRRVGVGRRELSACRVRSDLPRRRPVRALRSTSPT